MSERNCSVSGCIRPFKRSNAGVDYCYGHYMQAWRYGRPERPPQKPPQYGPVRRRVNKGGYVALTGIADHALARGGSVLEHRMVLFDAIGAGPHCCHWCQVAINWSVLVLDGRLVVDHLDENKANNDASNLVPSCHPCNVRRGRERDPRTGRLQLRVAPT